MTGSMTIFIIVDRKIAMSGRRVSGRGSWIRAKLAPKRTRASGTVIPPRNSPVNLELATIDTALATRHTCINHEGKWRTTIRALEHRSSKVRNVHKERLERRNERNRERDGECDRDGRDNRREGPEHAHEPPCAVQRRGDAVRVRVLRVLLVVVGALKSS